MTLSRITVVSHPTDVYESFANNFLRQVESVQSSNRTLKLILPVGPTAQYPIIADQVNRRNLSLKNLRIVLMDEYLDWQGRP
jgi:glucosamine-6-phosphate deaminase